MMTKTQIIECLRAGETVAAVAAKAKCSAPTIYRLMRGAGLSICIRRYTQSDDHAKSAPELRDDYASAKAVLTYAAKDGPMRVLVFCADLEEAAAARDASAKFWPGELICFHVEQRVPRPWSHGTDWVSR